MRCTIRSRSYRRRARTRSRVPARESVHAETRGDPEVSTAATGSDQVVTGMDRRSYPDAPRKCTVRAGSRCYGVRDKGVAHERRRDQIDHISRPAARAAHRHRATAGNACRMDAEPRSRRGWSPCEHECSHGYGHRSNGQSPVSPGHDFNHCRHSRAPT
jgi:hypothetical protein